MKDQTLVLVGLGLLGSSIASALKQQGWPGQIIGVSSRSSCQKALDLGYCDRVFGYDELDQWKPLADLILLCTPIEHILGMLTSLANSPTPFKPGVMISDVGSTKGQICDHAHALLDATGVCFVGGHPMAGSEKSGIDGADTTLFESALWILCPQTSSDLTQNPLLVELIQKLGGRQLILDAHLHDALVARISHVPQLLSSLLAATAGMQADSLEVAGPGFRDMSRLALSNFAMWKSILSTNQSSVHAVLMDFKSKFDLLLQSFDPTGPLDLERLELLFEQGRQARADLNVPMPQFRQGLCDIVVQIPDRPGLIASAVQPLSQAGIDIRDIELMRVRDGVGGTLRLAFKNRTEAEKAVDVLAQAHLHSWIKNP